jgi:hypothetical protein
VENKLNILEVKVEGLSKTVEFMMGTITTLVQELKEHKDIDDRLYADLTKAIVTLNLKLSRWEGMFVGGKFILGLICGAIGFLLGFFI